VTMVMRELGSSKISMVQYWGSTHGLLF
jgi:hypothetical protein